MKKKIKIAFLNHTAIIGGAERSLLDILKLIDKTKFTPIFICFEDGPLVKEIVELGTVEVIVIPFSESVLKYNRDKKSVFQLFSVLSLYKPLKKLMKYLKRNNIDILYTNSMKAHFIGLFSGKLLSRKVIWHVRDILDDGINKKIFVFLGKRVDKIICISKAVTKQFKTNPNLEVVYNGISPTDNINLQRKNRSNFQIAIIGQIANWKGQDVFIKAAIKLHNEFPDINFLIIGDVLFDKNEEVKYKNGLLGLAENHDYIKFLGHRNNVREIINDVDIIVHASKRAEPFGRVIIEGMASAKPVIASKIGGPIEIIEDGVSGILFDPDDISALTNSIKELVIDKEKYSKIAEGGHKRFIDNFDIRITLQEIEKGILEIYESK